MDYKALVQDDRIHASLYTDPRVFEDEMEHIFHRGWVFVGHDSEIPAPGDYVTRQIGREPVIMVRGKDGTVDVLVNRCMHRGWTYDLGGALLGVPYPGGYAALDKRAHGLARPPRVSAYRGFVFASLHPDGPTLAEHLGSATRLTAPPTGRCCRRTTATAITSASCMRAVSSWPSRTSSSRSCPSSPSTRCTGGWGAPPIACAAWTARSG